MIVFTITSRLARFAFFIVMDLLFFASFLAASDMALLNLDLVSLIGRMLRFVPSRLIVSSGASGLRGLLVMNSPFWAARGTLKVLAFLFAIWRVSSLKNDSVRLLKDNMLLKKMSIEFYRLFVEALFPVRIEMMSSGNLTSIPRSKSSTLP